MAKLDENIQKEVEEKRKEVESDLERFLSMLIEALHRNSVNVVVSKNPIDEANKFCDDNFGSIENNLDNLHLDFSTKPECVVSHALSVVADTGVVFFSGTKLKITSALADHHVAVILKEAIMPDMISAYKLALIKSGDEEIFASSSASKTADIEGKLVWGMRGPRKFTVILEGG